MDEHGSLPRDARRGAAVRAVVLLGVLGIAAADGQPGHQAGLLGRFTDSMRGRVLDVVGPDQIVERVDVNEVLDRVDVEHLLARVDVNRLLARVDVDALLARVDADALLDRVTVDRLLGRVDVNRLLERVDVTLLLDRVDVDALLDRVDVNRLLARVDPNPLLDRVDPDELLDRVEPDRLLDRVDVDRLMARVDVEQLVQRAGIPDIVAESTGSVAESALDLLRRQLLALDVVLMRGVTRLLGRTPADQPAGPPLLAGDGGPAYALPEPNAPVADVTGHYAGPVTRLVAYGIDTAVATGAFTLASGTLASATRWVLDVPDSRPGRGALFSAALVVWLFTYWWASTAVAGRTPAMAAVGLRITTREGMPLSGGRALLRVLFLPLSIAVFGLGLVGVVVDRERRGLHDVVAGSTVVYDWGDRRARLPTPLADWLARHAAPVDTAPHPAQTRPPAPPDDRPPPPDDRPPTG